VSALDLTLEAFHDAEYSSNLGRTTTDEDEGWILQPGARVTVDHENQALAVGATYDGRRRFYDDSSYDDDTTVTGSGHIEWEPIENVLTLDASNSRTESTIRAREALSPENRQEISTTVAGGTLSIPSVGAQHFDLAYHYDFYNTDETASDSVAQTGTASYVIPISVSKRVQLNADRSRVEFDSDLSPDYVAYVGELQFVSEGTDFELDTAAGYTEVDRSDGRDNTSGATGHLNLVWHPSADATLSLTYARAFDSRSPSRFIGIPNLGEEVTDDSVLDEVYVSDEASLGWSQVFGRNQLTVGTRYENIDYEDVDDDQESVGVNVSIERRLRPTVRGVLYTDLSRTEFDVDGRQDDDWNSGVRISWEGFRRLTIALTAAYSSRESDNESSEYDEWRGVLTLAYRLIGPRSSGAPTTAR
jgi:hypothetical protein